jgi:hypothetical protein
VQAVFHDEGQSDLTTVWKGTCVPTKRKFLLGSRRTFLYVTGAANRFVKIRVTLRTNDAKDPAARNFADTVAGALWRKTLRLH